MLLFFSDIWLVVSCEDPGLVDNSRRQVSGSRFAVGSSVEYICNKGYLLSGPGVLTCYSRDTADPKWSERLPKCVRKWYSICAVAFISQHHKKFNHKPKTVLPSSGL